MARGGDGERMTFALGHPSGEAGAVSLQIAPLDVPVLIEVASPRALGAVAEACRTWRGEAGRPPALRLRIERATELHGTGEAAIRLEGSRMTVRGPGVTAHAEVDAGIARCAVSSEYLANPEALRLEVLEPLLLMMLTQRDRTPVHASGFVVDGVAVLLAGRTGAGKSCLARAADAVGFQVLSDDTVYVQLLPRLTVWGWPGAAHVLPEDAPDAAAPTRVRGGKVKYVVPLRSASPAAIACHHAVLCVLSRSDGAPALSPISPADAKARLWPLDEGFDLLPGPIAAAVARLTAGGAWELQLSDDPAEAVGLLAASLPWLKETASFPAA